MAAIGKLHSMLEDMAERVTNIERVLTDETFLRRYRPKTGLRPSADVADMVERTGRLIRASVDPTVSLEPPAADG